MSVDDVASNIRPSLRVSLSVPTEAFAIPTLALLGLEPRNSWFRFRPPNEDATSNACPIPPPSSPQRPSHSGGGGETDVNDGGDGTGAEAGSRRGITWQILLATS